MKEIIRRLITKLIPTGLWLDLRQRPIIARHARIAELCRADIEKLRRGEIPPISINAKHDFGGKTVIWQYWGQGWNESELPEVVRLCAWSVDLYKGDCIVVRLSDSNLHEYIDLPKHILNKLASNPQFTRAFFSDLLRIALLYTYGGVWLDATTLLTRPLPKKYLSMNFFAYQRSNDQSDKDFWRASYYPYYGWDIRFRVRLLSSIIFGQANNPLLGALLALLCDYWQKYETLIEYFYLHICFNELVAEAYKQYNCDLVSDCPPHIIQVHLTGGNYPEISMSEALELFPIHKLTYKGVIPEQLQKLKKHIGYDN